MGDEVIRVARNIAVAMMCATIASPVIAKKTVTRPGATETTTATILRMDLATRYVVLRSDDGSETRVFVPPEFARFNELEIGDNLTLTYYESIVYRLRKPGAARPPVREEVGASESAGPLPGGMLSHQSTERVTVKAVDRNAQSITVTGRDGQTGSRRR